MASDTVFLYFTVGIGLLVAKVSFPYFLNIKISYISSAGSVANSPTTRPIDKEYLPILRLISLLRTRLLLLSLLLVQLVSVVPARVSLVTLLQHPCPTPDNLHHVPSSSVKIEFRGHFPKFLSNRMNSRSNQPENFQQPPTFIRSWCQRPS